MAESIDEKEKPIDETEKNNTQRFVGGIGFAIFSYK